MPYISQKRRDRMNSSIEGVSNMCPFAGDLNYAITKILHNYLDMYGLDYSNINEVIGVLECAKMELYRMVAAPYEDKKRSVNGGISSLEGE